MSIVSAVVLCTLVGAVGAIILVAASKFMAVEEDPRIEEVAGCLAGANCGGCGYAGCADYAKAVVMDGVPCDKCAPGGPKAAAAIAKIMGGEASAVEKKAVVQCQGNSEHCKPSYEYKGIQTCAAAATLYGGPKTCTLPASAWATAPRCVSLMPSTLWTAWPRWTRTSAPAVVPAPTSAPSTSL